MLEVFGIGLKKKKKLKSSSLSYSIVLVLIIGLLLSSLIILSGYHKKYLIILEKQNNLIDQAESTLRYAVDSYVLLEENVPYKPNAFSEITKFYWGGIAGIKYKVYHKGDTIKETVFLGHKPDNKALIIEDNNNHFSVIGKTKIEGDIFVPFGALNDYEVSGSVNSLAHKGKVFKSEGDLKEIDNISLPTSFYADEVDVYEETSNSFFNNTKKITIATKVLQNLNLTGNYLLESNGELIIKKNNILEDVIISASKVTIEKGFTGTIQVFSDSEIIIADEVLLKYPSLLYLKGAYKETKILISKKAKVLGAILHINKDRESKTIVEDKALVAGDLYTDGMLDFKGEMNGTIYAEETILKTEEAEYKNALKDLTIKKTPDYFLKMNFFKENNKEWNVIKRIK